MKTTKDDIKKMCVIIHNDLFFRKDISEETRDALTIILEAVNKQFSEEEIRKVKGFWQKLLE